MSLNSIKKLIGAASLALVATFGLSNNAFAQKGGTGVNNGEITWPTTFNIGAGAAANDNFQGNGTFVSPSGYSYNQSHGLANPEFHINMEIPIASNIMFAPRISYNDWSVQWDQSQSAPNGGPNSGEATISYKAIGADLLFKYAFNNFHVMAGANMSTPVQADFAPGTVEQSTHNGTEIVAKSSFLASLKGGLGYDIPVGSNMWITPEAFYNYPLTNFDQAKGSELFVTSVSAGASFKFAFPTMGQ
jgi:hypothetical protein